VTINSFMRMGRDKLIMLLWRCSQDGRIDYNEFVAMMRKGNVGFGKMDHNNHSFGLREALKLG